MKKIKTVARYMWQLPSIYNTIGFLFDSYERLTRYSLLKKHFKEGTGYDLDLENPKSFNQKICWKKVYDRNPLLPIVADKYRVREYLREVLGTEEAEMILVPLLYVTNKPETIPFDTLPQEYVIKANHGSAKNIIVQKGTVVDRSQIIAQCMMWLKTSYGLFKHEWAYQPIERRIIIEKLMIDENGHLPVDYKFHMFNGTCLMVQVNQGLFSDKTSRKITLYSSDWLKLNVTLNYPSSDDAEKPSNFNEMLKLAVVLSKPFDYIRVDLYSIKGKIFFGEFTNYPSSGAAQIQPKQFDFELGSKWQLQPKYWDKMKNLD